MTHEYFQSYEDYFWEWESTPDLVASIRGGNTIGYKGFLFAIIERLAPQGLPPFGSLLLAIAATNTKGLTSVQHINDLMTTRLNTADDVTLASAIKFLKTLADVPTAYKTEHRRGLLLQTIFEGCHNKVAMKDSLRISNECKNETVNLEKAARVSEFMMGTFRHDFKPLAVLNNKFSSAEEIIEKIGALPDTDEIEISFEESPAESTVPIDLIDELIENERTFTAGSLVRWLWGGLNIPVHSTLPSQQPLGGISDLTNKGDFDKLLISEFAYDDITFLSRLANNEALYFHREVPPANNNLQRIILIDASLKNWGTPKTIAFAVMLAITRHPKTDIACQGYVLDSKSYHLISITSIHTIIDALQIVSGSLHVAEGLASFLKDHGNDHNKEIFFITESTGLTQSPLLKVLNDHHEKINYMVLTDHEGNIDLYKRHQRARKHVQHIKLPLEELWKKKRVDKPLGRTTSANIEIPILVKAPQSAKQIVSAPNGEIFMLTEELSILRCFDKNSKNKGWELMYDGLPFHTGIFEMGLSDDGGYIALLYNTQAKEILLVSLSTLETKVVYFDKWKSTYSVPFVFDSGGFHHYNTTGAWRISSDGSITNSEIDRNKINSREKELKDLAKKYVSTAIIFKNINKIFINTHDELIFNKHKLDHRGEHIRLVTTTVMNEKIIAEKISNKEFQFPDGSTVEVNRSGFVVLKSSDQTISQIYIPTNLDTAIGIATNTKFAGNDYFAKEAAYEMRLTHSVNKAATIKALTDEFGMLHLEAQTVVASMLPWTWHEKCTKAKAEKIKATFKAANAVIEARAVANSQHRISTGDFISGIYTVFIQTVVRHGA